MALDGLAIRRFLDGLGRCGQRRQQQRARTVDGKLEHAGKVE
jgi:hypothetical protein